jgi:hypothetical protein
MVGEGRDGVMARKALSYGVLNIGGQQEQQHQPEQAAPELTAEVQRTPTVSEAHLVKNRAQQVMIYMRPEAHKALTRYALEQSTFRNKVKPHDLLVEAVQGWFDKHGLREQVRVEPEKGRGG